MKRKKDLSSAPRGRHVAGRHAAPKKARVAKKRAGALFGVAGVGTVTLTGGSSLAIGGTNHTIIAEPTPSIDATAPLVIASAADRAARASRSDNRTTLSDTEAISEASATNDPTVDPTVVIDTTPTVTTEQRRALLSVAGTTEELQTVVDQAQQQETEQATQMAAQQQAMIAAQAQAEQDAANAIKAAEEAKLVGVREAPIKSNYQLSARFGQRGYLWSKGWHTGLDFRVHIGTPVSAAANGLVISAERAGAYGNRIEIQHADGFVTTYNHLSEIDVKVGQRVAAGDFIGKSGNTGHTTGPHLHLEVLKDGELRNPATWLWGEDK